MGREKKYTPQELERTVNRYFKSISREAVVEEKVPTGVKDDKGHMIYEMKPVINSLGKQITYTQYLIPPSIGGLTEYLGIHRSTWSDTYCKIPAYSDTTTRARGRIHAYLEQESLTRQGKDLKGILFNLENNYGYKERLEVSNETMEDYLRSKAEEGTGGQEF